MHKQTVIDQIEIQRDGTIQLRFAKEIVDDDGTVLSKDWHRTALPPGQNIDAQMQVVNDHLVSMKCAAVDTAEIGRVKALEPVVWTKAVKDAYAAKQAELEAARKK